MNLELSNTDILFIYGLFIKKLKELDKYNETPNSGLSKTSVKKEKAPYLSVIEKIRAQYPNLIEMDKFW